MKIWMVPFSDNFVVHWMDFLMKRNIVVVNMENNFAVYVKETSLFWKNLFRSFIHIYWFSSFLRGSSHFGWIVLVIIVLLVIILFWARRRRQQQSMLIGLFLLFFWSLLFLIKELVMIPTEPPINEYNGPPPFYHPSPPPMGYPPPPPAGNPYAVPPNNQPGNFNPYAQQSYVPYPPQQQPFISY